MNKKGLSFFLIFVANFAVADGVPKLRPRGILPNPSRPILRVLPPVPRLELPFGVGVFDDPEPEGSCAVHLQDGDIRGEIDYAVDPRKFLVEAGGGFRNGRLRVAVAKIIPGPTMKVILSIEADGRSFTQMTELARPFEGDPIPINTLTVELDEAVDPDEQNAIAIQLEYWSEPMFVMFDRVELSVGRYSKDRISLRVYAPKEANIFPLSP